ncbi:unnamed protein product [Tuber melanosporum]|uniref:(Perigord truffle) hypothetical protein n=1 Tax=Tuber melanosporum (strain Mel28) TaxID=656061 RepID=D5G9H8_TUBMM|nr:uncharacterized protein GSTUM_00003408001 [Tuber melanosporum]CAZ81171.1 unnamed protein product [Tuber melanosporum]
MGGIALFAKKKRQEKQLAKACIPRRRHTSTNLSKLSSGGRSGFLLLLYYFGDMKLKFIIYG